ncbi:MAG: hypothetical protein ACYTHK_10010 [Planctomycetota bacterium]|jgi:hypothetical protein
MRLWHCLAVAAVAGLVVLAALVFRSSSGPAHRTLGRDDHGPAADQRRVPAGPGRPERDPGNSPTEAANEDNRNKPIPGTERWHYEKFLRLAAADPDGFDRLAGEKAVSDAPLQERIALLRAGWKVRGAQSLRWFSGAFARAGRPEDPSADELRGFVVRHLASHAEAAPGVRDFLRNRVFLDETVNARDRGVAGRAVLRTAEPGEISTLLLAIREIADATVADGAIVGLGLNDHASAASALTWLSINHPQKGVRDRAAEVSRRRLAGDVARDEED